MTEQLKNILITAVSIIVTGLASWLVALVTTWINSKIKDKKVAAWLTAITNIITSAVKTVFQTYVESLKKNNLFDEKAQQDALMKALVIIKTQLTEDLEKFIKDNYGDVEAWLTLQIETTIYNLKVNKSI